METRRRLIGSAAIWLPTILVPGLLYWQWAAVVSTRPLGVRLFYDQWDISYYFYTSAWAVGPEALFVGSAGAQYPLLANLLFGGVRVASSHLDGFASQLDAFAWVWMSLAWLAYVAAVRVVARRSGWRALGMWLTPATLYFALLRFDVFPALACVLALAALERERWLRGALWFGTCIALKGYALFLLPALVVFFGRRLGAGKACALGAAALAPFALAHLIAYRLGGIDAVLFPYHFQLERGVARESTYGAFLFVADILGVTSHDPGQVFDFRLGIVPLLLQAASAVAGAAFRPKSFDELVHALLFALLGFVVWGIFWSEQFLLWIVAIACFSSRRLVVVLTSLMCWLSFVEFPILYDLAAAAKDDPERMLRYQRGWRGVLVVTTALRFALMGLAVPARGAHFRNQEHATSL